MERDGTREGRRYLLEVEVETGRGIGVGHDGDRGRSRRSGLWEPQWGGLREGEVRYRLCAAQGRALLVGEGRCQAGVLARSPCTLEGVALTPPRPSSCFKAQWGAGPLRPCS